MSGSMAIFTPTAIGILGIRKRRNQCNQKEILTNENQPSQKKKKKKQEQTTTQTQSPYN
jgi:hypothetical protein